MSMGAQFMGCLDAESVLDLQGSISVSIWDTNPYNRTGRRCRQDSMGPSVHLQGPRPKGVWIEGPISISRWALTRSSILGIRLGVAPKGFFLDGP